MGSYPKGWINCPKICESIIANKFLIFKTPFDRAKSEFTHKDVLNHVDSLGKRIEVWIDLTKTDRYYNKADISKNNIYYKKIICTGHGVPPTYRQIDEFIWTCRNKATYYPNDNSLIAVHCTHGFNRTGFLLCHFLITEWGYTLSQFLSEFNAKRSPGIYRKNYLENLCWTFNFNFKFVRVPNEPFWTQERGRRNYNYNNSHESTNQPTRSDLRNIQKNLPAKLIINGEIDDKDPISKEVPKSNSNNFQQILPSSSKNNEPKPDHLSLNVPKSRKEFKPEQNTRNNNVPHAHDQSLKINAPEIIAISSEDEKPKPKKRKKYNRNKKKNVQNSSKITTCIK